MTGIPTLALAALLLLLVFGGLLALLLYSTVYGPRARLRRRLQQVVGGPKSRGGAKSVQAVSPSRRKALFSKLQDVEAKRQKKGGYKLREALSQADLAISVRQFSLISAAAALAAAGLGALAALPPLSLLAFATIGGLGLPRLVLTMMIKRRIKTFTGQFAEAIDVIVRGVRSGLPVGECFAMIAREMPDPVGTEFRLIVEGQRLGLTIDEVLQRASDRVPTAELRYFGIVLAIQQTTGGNLAETLAKLAEVLRARKRMRDKVQSMSSEAKSSAAIIGALPVLVAGALVVVAPKYIGVLFHTEPGHLILLAGAAIMATGVLVMRQMINFDI